MRTKLVKIIVISMAFAFLGTGISLAHEWKSGKNFGKGHAYGHYKQDKHQKFDHKRHYGHKHVVKHHHYYSTYKPYPYFAGQFIGFSFMDPNVAFSIAVGGH